MPADRAAGHDKWFRAQVEQAIKEADDPNTEWVSHEDAKASWAKKRAQLEECHSQSRLVAQSDVADTEMRRFMDEALADMDGWTA